MKKQLLFLSITALLSIGMASCGARPVTPIGPTGSSNIDPVPSIDASEGEDPVEEDYEDTDYHGKLRVYYHNDAGNYANKRIWAWTKGVDGQEYVFDNQTSPDSFGVYKDFDLSAEPWASAVSTTFSFIIKEAGSWSGQSTDTVVPYGRFVNYKDSEGLMTIYACDGEGGDIDTFTKREDALGDRLGTAYFSDWKTIHVEGAGVMEGREAADVGRVASYEVYAYDAVYERYNLEEKTLNKSKYLIASGEPGTNAFDIVLPEDAKPYLSYTVEARLSSDMKRKKAKSASFARLYDTEKFIRDYTYTGNDLGVTVEETAATFRAWAPTSNRVQVKMYTSGLPGDLHNEFDPSSNMGKTYEMEYAGQGVWQLRIDNFPFLEDVDEPYYYTYIVSNSAGTNETIDPYAEGSAINGIRGTILNAEDVPSPANWENIKSGGLLTDIARPNELSVYEAHIRDLTADATWNGTQRPGTFKAFIEEGTTYSMSKGEGSITVKTGFDHIKEMGVKAVQLLPVFDYDNDERWLNEEGLYVVERDMWGEEKTAPAYNWGYNPLNYNCVEGAYASNANSAVAAMREFKELVAKCAENDIRVIMDVVYNHFASVNGNPLQKMVPGYYLRTLEDGSYYDGTGCGNVTATERAMMRKFIVDSVCHWAKDYKVKGFRFDLMGCIDVATMRAVKDALYEIDPDIVVYGEGWAGLGDGGIYDVAKKHYPDAKQAALGHVYKDLGENGKGVVGAFSNGFRNGVKGDTKYGDITPEWGFVSTGADHMNDDLKKKTGEGILGKNFFNYDSDDSGVKFGTAVEQTVSYVACHDNYTLFDQLNWAINSQTKADVDPATPEVFQAAVSANAACLLNQGIAFINGGDEFFRQKVMKPDDPMWAKMEDSIIPYDESTGHTWVEGDGIKMDSGNYLVRNAYQYGDDVNSFKWDRKAKYFDYYEKIVEASKLRNCLMGTLLGRSSADSSGNNVFGSSYGNSTPLVACYLGGSDGGTYYAVYGGRFSDETYKSLQCGNCHIETLYSSNSVHKVGPENGFDITNELLGAAAYEYLLVRSTPLH